MCFLIQYLERNIFLISSLHAARLFSRNFTLGWFLLIEFHTSIALLIILLEPYKIVLDLGLLSWIFDASSLVSWLWSNISSFPFKAVGRASFRLSWAKRKFWWFTRSLNFRIFDNFRKGVADALGGWKCIILIALFCKTWSFFDTELCCPQIWAP